MDKSVSPQEFQTVLAEAMLSVMQLYQKICQEEKELIDMKQKYVHSWFALRMKTLRQYKDALTEAIDIGKEIGDGFAWIFYKDNMDELERHLKHKSVGLFTTGIGAVGEVEFIKNNVTLFDHFVLYHGVTSMLRVGDFSLYHPQYGIIGIGELKTVEEDGHLVITAYITSRIALPETDKTIYNDGFDFSSAKVQSVDRLKRQLQTVEDTLEKFKIDKRTDAYSNNMQEHLNNLSVGKQSVIVDIDSKTVVVGIPCMARKLSSTLLSDHQSDPDVLGTKLTDAVKEILVEKDEYNRLCFGDIRHKPVFGDIPLLWWEINFQTKKRLIFRKLQVMTIFNPVDIFHYFLDNGFAIEEYPSSKRGMGEVHCKKRIDGKEMTIGNIHWMFDSVAHGFFTVQSVISVMETLINQTNPATVTENTRINFRIVPHTFGKPKQ